MIELDGIEYNVQTPEENATALLTFINDFCAQNNITNIDGELIQIDNNLMNPLYMIIYGLSYLITICQKLIYSVGCSVSIPNASNRQLLNLARMMKTGLKSATATTITCTVFSATTGELVITQDLSVTLTVGTDTVVFHPAFDLTVAASTAVTSRSGVIILIAETLGPYVISEGAVTGFDTPVENLSKIISSASVPGHNAETISELRQRLISNTVGVTQIDACINAIEALPGITLCNIYFNYSSVTSETVDNIVVPPRHAALFVQGYSEDIAETFYKYLSCPMAGSDATTIIQYYTTAANQQLPVYIIPPTVAPIYLQIYTRTETVPTTEAVVGDQLVTFASSFAIGQTITTADILGALSDVTVMTIEDVRISTDNLTWSFRAIPTANMLFTLSGENITFIPTNV